MLRLVTSFAVAGAVLDTALAMVVSPGSKCASECGNVQNSASVNDLVCADSAYGSDTGQVFQGCLECELTSGYFQESTNYTDSEAVLYNVRYATSSCIFNNPKNPNVMPDSQCVTSKSCENFKEALAYDKLSTDSESFEYCDVWPTDDDVDFTACRECLRLKEYYTLANFMTVLQAGCEQRPEGAVTLAFDGDIFSTENVNTTEPTPVAKVDPAWFDHGPLGLGGKVGIAVGGFAFLLSILGFCIVWNGKRRRRAFLRTLDGKHSGSPKVWQQGNGMWPSALHHHPSREMHETPVSQRPLRGWDDSPMSAHTDQTFPRYFSPYSSQYNSPVSAVDGPLMQWPAAAAPGAPQNIGMALSDHGSGGGSWDAHASDNKGKMQQEHEAYEMHHVDSSGDNNQHRNQQHRHPEPPTLSHPGYGRNSDSPPRQYSLDEQDAQRGFAI